MKIGILTFHDTHNFGACLQAYALSEVLRRWGHEVEFINYHNDYLGSSQVIPVVSFLHYVRNPKLFIKALLFEKPIRRKYYNLKKFLLQDNSLSKAVTSENINEVLNDKDILIIGSDQVWNLKINGDDYTFFGKNINEDVICLTYAVSAGELWNQEQVNNISKYIGRFNHFLVREKSLAEQLRQMTDGTKDIHVVVDPTALLSCEEWKKKQSGMQEYNFENYILVYFHDQKLLQYVKEYAHKHGMEVILIYYGRHVDRTIHTVKPEKIEQWLWLIKHATIVYTSSYHCTLFALYLHTNFYVYNVKNSERLKSLLADLKLESRNLNFHRSIEDKIVWEDVDKRITEMRVESLGYLSDMLSEVVTR